MANQEIFIIGSKGIPAKYGGFESFVEQLTLRKKSESIHYNIACRRDLSVNTDDYYEYNGATCFNVSVPNIGPAKAILYDIKAFKQALDIIKRNNYRKPIVYVLACRIGPFINKFKKKLKEYDGILLVNPDGHEWLRAKWSTPVRKYWKLSERLMVKNADELICDSLNIEKYIQNTYKKYGPRTSYIAYGSDVVKSKLNFEDSVCKKWFQSKGISLDKYYLIVGRFVPENNYETMIKEFMKSDTDKDLVIVTNVEHNKFYGDLLNKTNFSSDKRIKFVGTVYEPELLKFIRENAFAYLHGHEVGGTNPSLLEALSYTKINLLLNVGFNREVGKFGARYWDKEEGSLCSLIQEAECFSDDEIQLLNRLSTERIEKQFNWNKIVFDYEEQFSEVGY